MATSILLWDLKYSFKNQRDICSRRSKGEPTFLFVSIVLHPGHDLARIYGDDESRSFALL